MAFWSRLKHEKHKFRYFAKEFNRLYTSNHINKPFSHNLIPISKNTNFSLDNNPIFFSKVRSYAAPVQFLQKKEEKDKDASVVKMNEQITAQFVRLVTDEGHSVLSKYDALVRARSLNLDLVEVDGNSKPPVCKMYNYKKEQLLQKVKEKEHKKKLKSKGLKSGGHKEIRFACKIGEHDLQMKADIVKKLIESGHRVKCTAIPVNKKKDEPGDPKELEKLLSRFSSLIEDVACKEGKPHIEEKQAFFVVRHIKFGPPRSGAKKASQTSTSESSKNGPSDEDEENTNDSVQTKTPELAVFDDNDDFQDEVTSKIGHIDAALSIPKHVIENRYAKVSGVVNEQNTSQIPNQVKQPRFNVNPSPRIPNQIPSLGRQDSSPRFPNQIPNLGRQDSSPRIPNHNSNPGRQDSPHLSFPNSPNKGFGIFSAQRENTHPNEQNAPVESNRYKKVDPSARSSNPTVPRINREPPVNNFEPRSNSNAFPNIANEGQAEFRRR